MRKRLKREIYLGCRAPVVSLYSRRLWRQVEDYDSLQKGLVSILAHLARILEPGGILALRDLLTPGEDSNTSSFLAFWLLLWFFGEVVSIYGLLVQRTGNEIIDVTFQAITVRRSVIGLSIPRQYAEKKIGNLRVSPRPRSDRSDVVGFVPGVIVFEYGERTIRFGNGVNEAEGNQILDIIRQRFSQYESHPPANPRPDGLKPRTGSMLPETHARLMMQFNAATLVVGVPLFFCLGCAWLSSDNIVPVLAFMGVWVAFYLFLWNRPVRCVIPECGGNMQKTRTKIAIFTDRLYYQCAICNTVYETDIFSPGGDD